jgi:hypothetical protein
MSQKATIYVAIIEYSLGEFVNCVLARNARLKTDELMYFNMKVAFVLQRCNELLRAISKTDSRQWQSTVLVVLFTISYGINNCRSPPGSLRQIHLSFAPELFAPPGFDVQKVHDAVDLKARWSQPGLLEHPEVASLGRFWLGAPRHVNQTLIVFFGIEWHPRKLRCQL